MPRYGVMDVELPGRRQWLAHYRSNQLDFGAQLGQRLEQVGGVGFRCPGMHRKADCCKTNKE